MLAIGVQVTQARRPLTLLFEPMMLVRLGSSAAASVFIVICLRQLPLATVNTVLQVTPLAVTAGGGLVFPARGSLARWAAAPAGVLWGPVGGSAGTRGGGAGERLVRP